MMSYTDIVDANTKNIASHLDFVNSDIDCLKLRMCSISNFQTMLTANACQLDKDIIRVNSQNAKITSKIVHLKSAYYDLIVNRYPRVQVTTDYKIIIYPCPETQDRLIVVTFDIDASLYVLCINCDLQHKCFADIPTLRAALTDVTNMPLKAHNTQKLTDCVSAICDIENRCLAIGCGTSRSDDTTLTVIYYNDTVKVVVTDHTYKIYQDEYIACTSSVDTLISIVRTVLKTR